MARGTKTRAPEGRTLSPIRTSGRGEPGLVPSAGEAGGEVTVGDRAAIGGTKSRRQVMPGAPMLFPGTVAWT